MSFGSKAQGWGVVVFETLNAFRVCDLLESDYTVLDA